jgi:putative transposase
MRLRGLQAKQVRRYKSTTRRNKKHPAAPNMWKQGFTAERPDQKWLTDMTYIPMREGLPYLAAVLDLFARRIVGWAMSERMTADLTAKALKMALGQRRPGAGLIHNSDQDSQYTDGGYPTKHERSRELVLQCAHESFFGTLKSEWVHHRAYCSREEAKADLFFYVEAFNYRRQRHSSLAMSVLGPMSNSAIKSMNYTHFSVYQTRGRSPFLIVLFSYLLSALSE